MVLVLIFAAIISFIAGETTNAYVILGIVVLVAIIGFVQEYKAEKAMEALREMGAPEADVIRDGQMSTIPAADLVPGDVVFLEAGDKVPADGRILEVTSLQVIESSLTGESMPVEKLAQTLPEDIALADRKNMVFMGTIISQGNCRAISPPRSRHRARKDSGLMKQEQAEPPLKIKLQQLAKRQALLVMVISAIVFILMFSRGLPVIDALSAPSLWQ